MIRIGRFSCESVACVGCPTWGIEFLRPSQNYGLWLLLDLPSRHFEFRLDESFVMENWYVVRCIRFWRMKLRGFHRGSAAAGKWFPDYM